MRVDLRFLISVFVGDDEEGEFGSALLDPLAHALDLFADSVEADGGLESAEEVVARLVIGGLGDEGVDDVFDLINDVPDAADERLDALALPPLLDGVLEKGAEDAEVLLQLHHLALRLGYQVGVVHQQVVQVAQ